MARMVPKARFARWEATLEATLEAMLEATLT
jgi:hypothetical protein